MRQSRMMSRVEARANVVVGLIIAFGTQIIVFPILGAAGIPGQNLKIALVFTCVSIVRGYWMRRLFDGLR